MIGFAAVRVLHVAEGGQNVETGLGHFKAQPAFQMVWAGVRGMLCICSDSI